MRKISAHYIFPVSSEPIKNGIITINKNGEILDIENPNGNFKEIAGLEFYNGILVPGFVNTHCHLELSHLKNKLDQKKGLANFVSQISKIRISNEELIKKEIKKANKAMQASGIVAVGDISNNNLSFETKQKSKIKYYTFIEVFATNNNKANIVFKRAEKLKQELETKKMGCSIVPHASYSVSNQLFKQIKRQNKNSIISIHNQETISENQLFINKTGKLYDKLIEIGVNFDDFKISSKNSLETISEKLPKNNKTILVHNTYSNKQDIEKASNYFKNLYWALCPNANLYIENKLPNIDLIQKLNQKITIGTDSYASNNKLSILEELKTINKHFPEISFTELLKWATINGAEALNLEKQIGSFEIGKTPGINLISNFDYKNFTLKHETKLSILD